MDLTPVFNSVRTAAEIGVAVLLFAGVLPRREGFGWRVTAFLAVLSTFLYLCVGLSDDSQAAGLAQTLLTYGVVVASCVAAIPLMFEADLWQALFCTTVGYTMQNLASSSGGLVTFLRQSWDSPVPGWIIPPCAMVVVYAVCYLVLVRRMRGERLVVAHDWRLFAMVAVVIVAVIGVDATTKSLQLMPDVPFESLLVLRIAHLIVCGFVILASFEMMHAARQRTEMATMRQLAEDERRQYELSRQTIENINVKCHDIRHQIRHMTDAFGGRSTVDPGVLDDIAHEVDVYDSRVSTGNEALDVILTERSLACEQGGIALSCMVDGAAVAFMSLADIYSFFGNALDNAMDAVAQLEDGDRRRISLVVREDLGMVSIHEENFFDGSVDLDGDLPRTSKADKANHGFGVLSMRRTAEKYGGTLVVSTDGDTFILDAAIPAP